jgi:hypothetical protein
MANQKGEKPNYIGTFILIIFMTYGFLIYDKLGSIETIQSVTAKSKIIPLIFHYINKTTIGYVIGRSSFLAVAIYGIVRIYKKFKNRPK